MISLLIIGGAVIILAILYCGILLGALSGLSIHEGTPTQPLPEEPFVSVIIPVRNEEKQIIRCLESLISQDYHPERFDVLISDDFSEDRTLEVIKSFLFQHALKSFNIITCDPGKSQDTGKKSALKRAIDKASGTLIMTTDADTLHDSGWISSMVRNYCETGAKMILGPVIFSEERTLFQKLQTLEFTGIMGLTAGLANIGHPVMCNGANLCYEKEAFNEVGGFDGNEQFSSGDDQFLLWKIKQKYGGHSIRFTDDRKAIVTTKAEKNPVSFFRQRLRWISKSSGYRDFAVILTGAISYLFPAVIVTGFILGIFFPLYLYLAISLLCFKILIDFPLVYMMVRFFGKQHLLIWYIPAQLFQVIYVAVSVPMAFLIPVKWKGRRV